MNDPRSQPSSLDALPPPLLPDAIALPAAEDIPPLLPAAPPRVPSNDDRIAQEFAEVQRVGLLYGFMLAPILVSIAWSHHTQTDDLETEFLAAAVLYLVIGIAAVAWQSDWRSLLRPPAPFTGRLAALTLIAPLLTFTAAQLSLSFASALGLPVLDLAKGYGEDGYPRALLVLLVVVLAPLFEEVAFRGILLSKLKKIMSPAQAIGVSAILFGVVHFSLLGMAFFLIPLGALAGYLTHKTKSLLPALFIHAAHNAGAVTLALLAQ